MLQCDLSHFFNLFGPLHALRIVDRDDKIRFDCGPDPLFNHFPRRHQVTHADHGKIMHQRRTQCRRHRADRTDAGNDPYFRLQRFRQLDHQFQHQAGHAVNSGVAAGNHRHTGAGFRPLDRCLAALHFLHHARADDLFAGNQVRHQVQIGVVTGDHCRLLHRLPGLNRHAYAMAGSDSHHRNFTSAIATVTLGYTVFGSNRLDALPPNKAAASHTFPTPISSCTNFEISSR